MTTHEDISKRAREIWEREGRPQGRDMEHWLQAEAELRQQSNGYDEQQVASQDHSMLRVPSDLTKEEPPRKRSARRGR